MTELAWLADVGKLLGGAATGWFSRVAAERGKRRVMRRGLYKEIAYNAAMLHAMTKDGQQNRDDALVHGLVATALRRSYFEQARASRAAFDELDESYTFEDVYKGFDWITEDVTNYAPGVVHSRMRGALHKIRHHIDTKQLSKRLLVRMAPAVHRASLGRMFAEPMD